MARTTNYSNIRNLLLIVSFNQPAENGTKYQPAVIEARCEAITDEGAVRSVVNTVGVGAVTQTPLTLKQIYNQVNKTTVGALLAGALKDCLLDAINTDPSV